MARSGKTLSLFNPGERVHSKVVFSMGHAGKNKPFVLRGNGEGKLSVSGFGRGPETISRLDGTYMNISYRYHYCTVQMRPKVSRSAVTQIVSPSFICKINKVYKVTFCLHKH